MPLLKLYIQVLTFKARQVPSGPAGAPPHRERREYFILVSSNGCPYSESYTAPLPTSSCSLYCRITSSPIWLDQTLYCSATKEISGTWTKHSAATLAVRNLEKRSFNRGMSYIGGKQNSALCCNVQLLQKSRQVDVKEVAEQRLRIV